SASTAARSASVAGRTLIFAASATIVLRCRGGQRRRHGHTPPLAIVGVRADIHAAAAVVGDDLVEEAVRRTAQRACAVETIALERMVFEVERHNICVRRDRVDALLASGAKQLKGR